MKKRMRLILFVFILFLGFHHLLVSQEATSQSPSRPNIILILIDDMGYGDIEPFGCTKAKTPALNQMAKEGMKLNSFYVSPVCSASRASFLTGCYSPRVSVPDVFHPCSKVGLNPQENSVAKLLKAQGYETMCIGKWHLGDQPEFLPQKFGFDHYYGIPYSNDMLLTSVESQKRTLPLMRDQQTEELLAGDQQEKLAKVYTEEAVKFIKKNQKAPFFLYLAHNAVHVPIYPGPEFRGKSGNGGYYDWVQEVDWSAGQVLNALKECHLESNTLVIFTSDNGPWLAHGANAGSAGPLRGGKGSTWEGGVRESTIAWWPGKIKAESSTDVITGAIDLLPTFVRLGGGEIPSDKPIDGVDISDLLLGKSQEAARKTHFYYMGYVLQAVRSGPWKLALTPQNYGMGFKETPELHGEFKPGLRLYNLEQDPGEKNDLSAQFPDEVQRLKALADEQKRVFCNNSPKGPGVRPSGIVENPQYLYPVIPKKNKGKGEEGGH